MKRFSLGALVMIILGCLIALAPYFIFPVCQAGVPTASGGVLPMKCFWTARASLGNGGLVVFGGLLLLFAKTPGPRLGVALMLLAAGLLTVLTPHQLIGVCPDGMMPCRIGTLPALTLLGLLVMLAALAVAVRAKKNMRANSRRADAKAVRRSESGSGPDMGQGGGDA